VDQFTHASNSDLIAAVAGKPAADALFKRYGALTDLAQASVEELREVHGVGPSKAAAIRSAFLLAQRLAKRNRTPMRHF